MVGCDDSSGRSESEIVEDIMSTDKYDSYITFKYDGINNNDDIKALADLLTNRLDNACSEKKQDHTGMSRQTQSNHMDKTITIYFNNTKKLTEDYFQAAAAHNLVEFRKGDTKQSEVFLKTEDVLDAYPVQEGSQWTVAVEFIHTSKSKFANTVKELAGKTPITVWLDGTKVNASVLSDASNKYNAILSGNFDEGTAKKLAFSLRAGYMEANVTVDVCLLNRNRT